MNVVEFALDDDAFWSPPGDSWVQSYGNTKGEVVSMEFVWEPLINEDWPPIEKPMKVRQEPWDYIGWAHSGQRENRHGTRVIKVVMKVEKRVRCGWWPGHEARKLANAERSGRQQEMFDGED